MEGPSPMDRQADLQTTVRQVQWSDTASSLSVAVEALNDQLHYIRHNVDIQVLRSEILWQADQEHWLINVLAEYSRREDLLTHPQPLTVVAEDE